MEKDRSKSVEEVTETLKILSKKVSTSGLSAELRDFVCMLKAHKLRHTTDAHAFCKNGGMQVLLELLQHCEANNQDLIVVLGTIGNVCALHHSARSITMSKGLERIVGYLQLSTTSDVVGTTARVLANLAHDRAHVSVLHQHSVVGQLSQLLVQGDVDVNCKKNVVRALRLLCSDHECLEELKQSNGMPLILDCLKSEHVELALCSLQTIEVASADGDPDILQYLCDKEIMQCIIRYCNHSMSKVKRRAMHVLLNSAKILDGRRALSSAGGVETLVAFMESSDKRSTIFGEVVCALCTCCRDVISRQRLRDCGGLERLVAMLADPNYRVLHGNMMAALVCYYFDENTLKLMVTKMGFQQTLNYHLKRMTSKSKGTHEEFHPCSSEQEEEIATPTCDEPSSETSVEMTEMIESTPSHISAEDKHISSAVSDSPPPSKRPRLEAETDSSSGTPPSFLDSLLSSPSPYRNISIASQPPNSPIVGDVDSTFESQVILMVSRMSHMRDCLFTLSYVDILPTILDYFISTQPPNLHIFKVLMRVFMNPHCFQNCLSSLVPLKLHKIFRQLDVPPPLTSGDADLIELCQRLMEHMSKNAESPYGQGVLAHLLLRGSNKEKQASCLSMPLLCRSPRICHKLMMDYGAFKILCELLKDDSHEEVWEMAVDAMLALGRNMHMQHMTCHKRRYSAATLPPELQLYTRRFPFSRLDCSFRDLSLSETAVQQQQCQGEGHLTYCKYMDTDHHPFDLTMTLHSSSGELVKVPAHKSTLVEESDVFRVMLAGSYKESSCGDVHIHSISPLGFLSVLHHIYGCGWQCKSVLDEVCATSEEELAILPSQSDLLSAMTDGLLNAVTTACGSREEGVRARHCLQVLACAGRFLLPDLITLSEHAAAKYLCPGNMVPMFQFAQLHLCFCLAESCIRALVSLPHLQLRTDVFKELVTSAEGEAAIEIILLFLTAADF